MRIDAISYLPNKVTIPRLHAARLQRPTKVAYSKCTTRVIQTLIENFCGIKISVLCICKDSNKSNLLNQNFL